MKVRDPYKALIKVVQHNFRQAAARIVEREKEKVTSDRADTKAKLGKVLGLSPQQMNNLLHSHEDRRIPPRVIYAMWYHFQVDITGGLYEQLSSMRERVDRFESKKTESPTKAIVKVKK